MVLVGCQGDNKVHQANTLLDQDLVLDTDNVVMHVETAASSSAKSVMVAFQVNEMTSKTSHCSKQQRQVGSLTLTNLG